MQLAVVLKRLAYPNRLAGMETFFGMSKQKLSNLFYAGLEHIAAHFQRLLDTVPDWVEWGDCAQAVASKGAGLQN